MNIFFKPKVETIKSNARPKPRNFSKFIKKIRSSPDLKDRVKKKEITDEELEDVKSKIREKTTRVNRRKTIFRLLLVVVLLLPVYFIGQSFYKSIEKGRLITEKKHEETYKQRQKLIVEGFQQLKVRQYFRAKTKFLNAAKIDPDDYLLQLGLTKTYVKLCRYKGTNCKEAKESLNALVLEYGNLPEVEEVSNEYTEMLNKRKK